MIRLNLDSSWQKQFTKLWSSCNQKIPLTKNRYPIGRLGLTYATWRQTRDGTIPNRKNERTRPNPKLKNFRRERAVSIIIIMIWSCVEERVIIKRDNGQTYGRMVRRIVFGDIFADKMAVLSRNPIPIIAHRHLNVS